MYDDDSARKKYLAMEIPHINNFLLDFRFSNPAIKPEIVIDDNYKWIGIKNFPLPDEYSPDYMDIAIVIVDYPVHGPTGFYINSTSENISKVMLSMQHTSAPPFLSSPQIELPGWSWVGFQHYERQQWYFNHSDLMQGDNLANYVKAVYENLWSSDLQYRPD